MLRQGRAVAEGAPPQVLTAELIAEVYGVQAAVARTESGGMAILPESAIETGR
jgi:iron complex transport system ATP-binding protein